MLFICYNYVLLLILSWWLGETDAVGCFDLIWLDVCIQRPNVTHVQNWKLKAINWMGFLCSGFLMIFGFIHLDESLGLCGCLIILVSLSSPFTIATTLYDCTDGMCPNVPYSMCSNVWAVKFFMVFGVWYCFSKWYVNRKWLFCFYAAKVIFSFISDQFNFLFIHFHFFCCYSFIFINWFNLKGNPKNIIQMFRLI